LPRQFREVALEQQIARQRLLDPARLRMRASHGNPPSAVRHQFNGLRQHNARSRQSLNNPIPQSRHLLLDPPYGG
jgi:hypothetical protein